MNADFAGDCRLRVEPSPTDGAWNMAVDEAMLLDAIDNGRCWLRLYRWSEPTLSLGYFQKSADRPDDPLLDGLPCVRRLSGGGAIVHDDELTYSCVVPSGHPFARNPLELYDVIHRAIVVILNDRGADVTFRAEPDRAADAHFLCFSRGDERDLVLGGHKVLGSAQRRRKGAVLQHGSLLLRASVHAPHLPGVLDLAPEFDGATFAGGIAQALVNALPGPFDTDPINDIDRRAQELLERPQTTPKSRQGLV